MWARFVSALFWFGKPMDGRHQTRPSFTLFYSHLRRTHPSVCGRMQSPEAQLEALRRGAAKILSEGELLQKLKLRRPLNVKLGVDPTAPDIHLGFAVALTKLRQFQDLGHQAILIIGDFTAMIGDPAGRSKARPQLTHDQVMSNAHSFQQQAYKILDPQRTRTVFNGEWFEIMTFEQVMR